jgi:DNA repair protein RadA/Sms
MAKARASYLCRRCGERSAQWQGQCPGCGEWNTLTLSAEAAPRAPAGGPASQTLGRIAAPESRLPSGMGEFDRVLGGGLVPGSVTLIGGEPGIGKSTLLLQAAAALSSASAVLYATGEESSDQIGQRAARLELTPGQLAVLPETRIDAVLEQARRIPARVLIVDSIQTMVLDDLPGSAGSVTQLRAAAGALVAHAKATGTAVLIIGHVTKEGLIAGPRLLEHLVDTVLYFESEAGSRLRLVRAVKNRYGAAQEIGVFAMGEHGLREVKNPSAIFLSRHETPVPGSIVLVTREGTRPLLVEVQALVDESRAQLPRRVAVGLDANRVALLLAVLHRHARVSLGSHDVFVNVVGGVRIEETAADLPALLAVVSSLEERPIASDLLCFGELGLAGEVRPVAGGEDRLRAAAKHGFRRAIVPKANLPKSDVGLELIPVTRLVEALGALGDRG